MSAILEIPEVRARVSLLSVEAYDALTEMGALDKSAELIRGVIVKKMPKSPLHRALAKKIFLFLLALERAGFVAFIETPLRLADSVPEPDVMLVRGADSDYKTKHPTGAELVIEIAVSSVALDRENALLYAEAGVPEYWIVLGSEQRIEVYRQPENGIYQQREFFSASDTLFCKSVPDLVVTVAEWFA